MKYIVLFITATGCSLSTQLYGLRDPFFYPDDEHRYACIAIGSLNNRPQCATIMIDGLSFCVRAHRQVYGHTIVAITDQSVTLRDSAGLCHTLIMSEKKTLQLR